MSILAQEYLQLQEDIKKLEEKKDRIKKELIEKLPLGSTISHFGVLYEWNNYPRTSNSWKPLYTKAVGLLDDEGKVIMSEAELHSQKTSDVYTFKPQKG